MKTLLNQVLTSNSLHKSHQVAVSIVEGENTLVNAITNPEEIKSAMDKIGEDNEYQVLVTSVNEEGYVTGIALDANDEIIGYKFVSLGKMTDFIKKGDDPNTAYEKACGQYGRVDDAVRIIDPRCE